VILVAGSRGFIGQHVVAHLQSTGRPFRELDGDVRDAANVTAAAQGCSAIIHLAFKNLNVDGKGFDTNIVGTQNAVNAARQVGGILGAQAVTDLLDAPKVEPTYPQDNLRSRP